LLYCYVNNNNYIYSYSSTKYIVSIKNDYKLKLYLHFLSQCTEM